MATGTKGYLETGGVMAPADYPYGGDQDRESLIGLSPSHPLMGGGPAPSGSYGMFDTDYHTTPASVISTLPGTDYGRTTPAHDDWRDLLDFRNSPLPYIALFTLAMIGLVQFRIVARGGPARASASLG